LSILHDSLIHKKNNICKQQMMPENFLKQTKLTTVAVCWVHKQDQGRVLLLSMYDAIQEHQQPV
jgi:hypothetical protein